jgi:CubicO group peptidase (beta-lactamase class C family)
MMTRRTKLVATITALAGGMFGSACAADVSGNAALAGRWGGFLAVGPGLRVILEIAAGQPIVLISVDQSNARIPATGGSCGPNALDLQFGSVRASLKLTLTAQGSLVGKFKQGQERDVTFSRLAAGQLPTRPAAAPFADLQAEVTAQRTKAGIPALGGAFISVVAGQTKSAEAVSGVLVAGETAAVTSGMKWHVGSITKSMTATLVARLVERGLLSWDMKLGDVFADIAPDMLPAYRGATLAQLMTGRAGLPTNISVASIFGHVASEQTPTQRRKVWVREALALKPETEVGGAFVYPNNGYVLAGTLCEKVTDKTYEILMDEEVFAPLGMASAGFGPPPLGNPQGHSKGLMGGRLKAQGVDPTGADNPPPMSPAGRAHMSLPDLAKFGLAHSEGNQGLRNDYLKRETWQFLHTPLPLKSGYNDYAFGWRVFEDGTLRHNGSNTMWLAELAFDPAKSRAACACGNAFDCEDAVGRVLATGLHLGA